MSGYRIHMHTGRLLAHVLPDGEVTMGAGIVFKIGGQGTVTPPEPTPEQPADTKKG